MQILSVVGSPLDATFSVRSSDAGEEVTLESRGPRRNTRYGPGLRTLLERLRALDALLLDAYLDTRQTRRQGLTQDERRLSLPAGSSYPLRLGAADVDALAAALTASQAGIGQAAGARGGNVTRRMTMLVSAAGRPFPRPLDEVLAGEPLSGLLAPGAQYEPAEAQPLALDGPLETLVTRAARREQQMLRRQRLGSTTEAPCDLCARVFPVHHLRAAHIKKRSLCTSAEKLDPNVAMVACIECDALFESGDVIVDADGTIRATRRNPVTPDLETLVNARAGKPCCAFSPSTASYFSFHRDQQTWPTGEPTG